MSSPAANAPTIDEAAGTVTYEQPLAERMRTFLRLEFLAQQANHHSLQASTWSSRAAIGSLLEILTILGRGDIRGDVLIGNDSSGRIDVRNVGGSFVVENDTSGEIAHRDVAGAVSLPEYRNEG